MYRSAFKPRGANFICFTVPSNVTVLTYTDCYFHVHVYIKRGVCDTTLWDKVCHLLQSQVVIQLLEIMLRKFYTIELESSETLSYEYCSFCVGIQFVGSIFNWHRFFAPGLFLYLKISSECVGYSGFALRRLLTY